MFFFDNSYIHSWQNWQNRLQTSCIHTGKCWQTRHVNVHLWITTTRAMSKSKPTLNQGSLTCNLHHLSICKTTQHHTYSIQYVSKTLEIPRNALDHWESSWTRPPALCPSVFCSCILDWGQVRLMHACGYSQPTSPPASQPTKSEEFQHRGLDWLTAASRLAQPILDRGLAGYSQPAHCRLNLSWAPLWPWGGGQLQGATQASTKNIYTKKTFFFVYIYIYVCLCGSLYNPALATSTSLCTSRMHTAVCACSTATHNLTLAPGGFSTFHFPLLLENYIWGRLVKVQPPFKRY